MTSSVTRRERTLEMAHGFLEEVRRDLTRTAPSGADLPPRVRSVHERAGHATPEYRTLAVPVPEDGGGASPQVLSEVIAQYAARKAPICLILAFDAVMRTAAGESQPVLLAEARDQAGTRLFLMQPFRVEGSRVRWEDPVEGGWRDPGEEEMILDASFAG